MKAILIVLLLPVIYYVLYRNGSIVTGKKSAKVFVGKSRGPNAYWTQFAECSGELKRMVRFRKSKEYTLFLNANITEGTVTVEILDKDKQVILCLTPEEKAGSLIADRKQKYYMVYRFENASGAYEISWE